MSETQSQNLGVEVDLSSTSDVVKSMLVEKTGRHFLDSGNAYGRHWEENQENAPWNDPAYVVESDYVVRNVYHFLANADIARDGYVAEIEREFYEWANRPENKREGWLALMRDWADENGVGEAFTDNTYNFDSTLSQVLQFVAYEDMGGETILMVQVHQGCDVRGGYTKPRLFKGYKFALCPHEMSFWCPSCNWEEWDSTIDYDVLETMTDPEANTLTCPECESPEVRPS